MPKVTDSGFKHPFVITITGARNGVTVIGRREDAEQELRYVYTNLNKALREIKSLVSVLDDKKEKVTDESLKEEEEDINEKARKEKY